MDKVFKLAFCIYQAYFLRVFCITLILASGATIGYGIPAAPITIRPMSPNVTCFQDQPCKTNDQCNGFCTSKGYKTGGFCGGNSTAMFCCCTS